MLSMNDDWFTLREELKRAERWERIERVNKRSMLTEVQNTMDWKPWQRLTPTLNCRDSVALLAWHQGAPFTKMGDHEEHRCIQTTLMHLLWLCKHTQQQFPEMEPEDKFEIDHGLNLEFWIQGILQLPKYELATGGAAQAWDDQGQQPRGVHHRHCSNKQRQPTQALCGRPRQTWVWRRALQNGHSGHSAPWKADLGESMVLWSAWQRTTST